MTEAATEPLAIAIRVADRALADRIALLLRDVAGLRIARDGDAADVVVSLPGADAETLSQPLTGREREVVALLAEGLSNKEIALRLGIAPDTAKFHVARVIDKLDATGRTDAVAHAARLGVIHL
jgi:DNA-binding CsgD family transcriptional regulator